MNFGFVIDNRKCIGCHACTVACKSEHDVPIGVNRTWVKYIEKGHFPDVTRHFSVMRCNHCSDAPCVEICPVSALFVRSDGIVDFDNRRCIGCKACMQACPYDALYLDPQTHTAAKCNFCAHRIDVGLAPSCVNVCPEEAIIFGDLDDPSSGISGLLAHEKVSARKEEKGTLPKLFYIDGDRVSLNPEAAPPAQDYLWSSQSEGVGHFARFAADKIAQAPRDDLVERLDPGSAQRSKGEGPSSEAQQSSNARRVYDVPDKGVLWGWEVSGYIWTKALSAGAFLIPFTLERLGVALDRKTLWMSILTALVFLALTGILLVKDLDRPARFLYVLLRPQWRSWLVRGAAILTLFGTGLAALLVTLWLDVRIEALEWGTAGAAAATAVYTAFLFAQAKGRDFWQSPALALHMLIQAVLAGSALWMLLDGSLKWLSPALATALFLHAANLLFELTMPHSSRDAQAAAALIWRGPLRTAFWGGAVAVGIVLPVVSLWAGWPALAAVAVLVGLFVQEHLWCRAPQLIPLS